jgi:FkbM family methyltransferase
MNTNSLKLACMQFYTQIHARKNLYHVRDRRWRNFRLNPVLTQAALVWPEVLPWIPNIILDIGAHKGDVADELSQLYHPDFIAMVEPLPQMAEILRKKSYARNQRVFECALGSNAGTAQLNVLASPASSSIFEVTPGCDELFKRPLHTVEVLEVPMRTLDEIFYECELSYLDLLKIDVQGYEIEVFRGGRETLNKTHCISVEVSFFEHYRDQPQFIQVYEVLKDAGFELNRLFGYQCDRNGILLQCDALFINGHWPRRASSA